MLRPTPERARAIPFKIAHLEKIKAAAKASDSNIARLIFHVWQDRLTQLGGNKT